MLGAPAAAQQPAELPHTRSSASPSATRPPPAPDRFALLARSETYVQLFRRALSPGPGGSVVSNDAASPLTQYLLVQARNVDSPWHLDSIDMEVAAWGQVWPTRSDFERPFDGDLQSANLTYRAGPLSLRAGRQLLAGGAAGFARFDGLTLTGTLPADLYLIAYGGWTVLPRWDARPGYHRLGLAERELSSTQELRLARAGHWLSGARFGYQGPRAKASASFHEQHERLGVAHRNLGVDASGSLADSADAGGNALYELDQRHFAEVRAWLELRPLRGISATLEGLRSKPGLLLSRQSVLSVFGTSAYDEGGGFLSWQALASLRLEASGYLERYAGGRVGTRGEGTARFELGPARRTLLRLSYGRVLVAGNGYHSVRAALGRKLGQRLSSTLEAYGYFYDKAVLGYHTSTMYSGTLSYSLLEALELLWGASLFRSPYASLDAQTLVRLSYELDAGPRGLP